MAECPHQALRQTVVPSRTVTHHVAQQMQNTAEKCLRRTDKSDARRSTARLRLQRAVSDPAQKLEEQLKPLTSGLVTDQILFHE
jgi:hypothetical protein